MSSACPSASSVAGESGDTRSIAGSNYLRSLPEPKQPEFLATAKKTTACAACLIDAVSHLADVTDRMLGLLMERADALMGCLEGSAEDAELAMLTDIIEAYERQRWPDGRIPGGKGWTQRMVAA